MKYWDKAWSIISGCTPVSPACDNCWLAGMEYRFDRIPGLLQVVNGVRQPKFGGNIICHSDRLDIPLKTKKPTVFAVWSDLFHEKVPDEFIAKAFNTMVTTKHIYLICSKRTKRMANFVNDFIKPLHKIISLELPRNVYLGTTVEFQTMADKRIPELLKCEPFKLFLSVEPMLSEIIIPVELLKKISYVICGCESGHHARETKEEWIRVLRDQCLAVKLPLWVKQLRVGGKMIYNHSLSTIQREGLWTKKRK